MLLPNDLKVFLNENGFNPSKKTLYELISEYDIDETGGISFTEFMRAMVSRPIEKDKKEQIKHVFKKYARNKDYITV